MKNLIYYPIVAFPLLLAMFIVSSNEKPILCEERHEEAFVSDIKKKVEEVKGKNQGARISAKVELAKIKAGLSDTLVATLRELSDKPDAAFLSSLYLTVGLTGEWRIEEAVPLLLNIIDYEVDRSTIPVGIDFAPFALFPAAYALTQIGGQQLAKAITSRLRTEENEKITRLCAWVLFRTHGEDVAGFILAKEEASAKDEAVKQRMKKAKELVAQGDRLLLFDEKPQGTDKEATPASPAGGEAAPSEENNSAPPASDETPMARNGAAQSSLPTVSSRPTGASSVVPSATNTGPPSATTTSAATDTQFPAEQRAEGAVAEATPIPWAIIIVGAIGALSAGAITTLLLTRRKKA